MRTIAAPTGVLGVIGQFDLPAISGTGFTAASISGQDGSSGVGAAGGNGDFSNSGACGNGVTGIGGGWNSGDGSGALSLAATPASVAATALMQLLEVA